MLNFPQLEAGMRNLAAKGLWIFLGDGGAKLFGFLASIYLARTLGVEQYGLITIAISVLSIVSWFSDLGIKTLATRSMAASDPGQRDPSRFLWLKITLSCLVIAGSASLTWLLLHGQPELRNLILLFILSLLPQALNIDWYYKGIQKFERITLAHWVQGSIYLLGLLLLVSARDLLTVPMIYSFSLLAGAFTMILSYRGKTPLSRWPDTRHWLSDITSSFYLGAGHFLAQSVILLPPLIIGSFFSELQVGFYGVALKLILAAMLVDHIINTLMLPNLTKLWNENRREVQPQLMIISRWVLLIGAAGTLILSLSAGQLIHGLFGDEYSRAAPMLIMLSLLLPVTFLNSVYTFGLISFGRDRSFLVSTCCGAAGAAFVMIAASLSGEVRVVVASVVISEIWMTICMFYQFKRVMDLPLGRYTLALVLILALLLAAGYWLVPSGFIAAIIAPLLLAGFLYIFGLLQTADLTWMKRRMTL
ncbi:MAG: oligosaccharide flippase family protein [Bacteroidetes bacterium]|nr:oligosaccharide flippase family protein [Bacteroidota bacterium]